MLTRHRAFYCNCCQPSSIFRAHLPSAACFSTGRSAHYYVVVVTLLLLSCSCQAVDDIGCMGGLCLQCCSSASTPSVRSAQRPLLALALVPRPALSNRDEPLSAHISLTALHMAWQLHGSMRLLPAFTFVAATSTASHDTSPHRAITRISTNAACQSRSLLSGEAHDAQGPFDDGAAPRKAALYVLVDILEFCAPDAAPLLPALLPPLLSASAADPDPSTRQVRMSVSRHWRCNKKNC